MLKARVCVSKLLDSNRCLANGFKYLEGMAKVPCTNLHPLQHGQHAMSEGDNDDVRSSGVRVVPGNEDDTPDEFVGAAESSTTKDDGGRDVQPAPIGRKGLTTIP